MDSQEARYFLAWLVGEILSSTEGSKAVITKDVILEGELTFHRGDTVTVFIRKVALCGKDDKKIKSALVIVTVIEGSGNYAVMRERLNPEQFYQLSEKAVKTKAKDILFVFISNEKR